MTKRLNAGFGPANLVYPIVGNKFRPKICQNILSQLPTNTKLQLWAEPDNPFDRYAIMVWVDGNEIPTAVIHKIESFDLSAAYHLGYIPRNDAKYLRETRDFPLNTGIDAQLTFKMDSTLPHAKILT